uniref:Uncharacterized protein n=1 Tax=Arion vulgaris TaxID=1028688 RepID=A0A0B6ZYY1_9EUPU
MELGSKFVYLGNDAEDDEEVVLSNVNGVVLSDSESDESNDDGEVCLLDILDTAGQEEYSSQKDMYVHSADGIVIIYSITDRDSFTLAESIFIWLKHLTQCNPFSILVANKQDLTSEATVTSQEGIDLALKLGIPFYETSAKTGTGVVEAMTGLVKIIPRISTDYRIVMLGGGAVGKSSITIRFTSNSFVENYDPTIEDSYRKMIRVKGLQPLSKEEKKVLRKKKKSNADSGVMGIFPTNRAASGKNSLSFVQKLFGPKSEPQLGNSMRRPPRSHQSSRPPFPESRSQSFESSPSKNKVKVTEKKTDGNVVLIALKILGDEPNLVTGDPIKCAGCLAVLTSTAVLVEDGDTMTWNCEFCGHVNSGLNISENEIPKGDSFDFMLSPATKSTADNTGEEVVLEKKKETSLGVTVYCMDKYINE